MASKIQISEYRSGTKSHPTGWTLKGDLRDMKHAKETFNRICQESNDYIKKYGKRLMTKKEKDIEAKKAYDELWAILDGEGEQGETICS